MATPRVLIVDDQKEVVRLLQSAIESTGHDVEVVGAPSGEEAMLEIMQRPVDLLIVDYMLPGISGIELMERIRRRNPDLQAIFITGHTNRAIHREIMEANAQAFFVKPVPMADFLDVVERLLGLHKPSFMPEEAFIAPEHEHENLSDVLAEFRQQQNAEAAILLDEQGSVIVQAGSLPGVEHESKLYANLVSMLSHGNEVLEALSDESYSQFWVFSLPAFDVLVMPATGRHLLVLSGEALASPERISATLTAMRATCEEVREMLIMLKAYELGEVAHVEDHQPASADEPEPSTEEEPVAEDLLALLESAQVELPDPNSFWETAVEEHKPQPFLPDVITYEQALQLGLAPDEDDTEA